MSPRKPTRAMGLGVTDDEYAARLAAQGGGCAICGNPPKTRRLNVDHVHRTGAVRGLLCFVCNHYVLGKYASPDKLLAAALYLHDHSDDEDMAEPWGYVRDHLTHVGWRGTFGRWGRADAS